MFWNNLYELCKANQKTPSAVVKELDISAGSITKWKNGTIPSKTTLEKLAQYFGVRCEYFFADNSDTEPQIKRDDLTEVELRVLSAYRMHPEMQPAVLCLLGLEADNNVCVYTAASSSDKRQDEIVKMSKSDWENIKNAPETDDKLL